MWNTQRWFASVLVAMVVLVLGASVVGAHLLNRTAAVSNRLSDRISPARTAVVQLDGALREQEAAVHGFLLSGVTDFADSYQQAVGAERQDEARLRELIDDQPAALADLTAVEEQAATWRATVAEPLMQAATTGTGDAVRARAAFTSVRTRLTDLDNRLVGARAAGRDALSESRRIRDDVFLTLIGGLLLFIVAIGVLLRLIVLGPLARLGGEVRRVAGGDFEHRVTPRGPADVVALGHDVEAMRERLADALAESRQQQVTLSRVNADLEQFAYVASHDLQEPLRKVASFCQMLQRRYGEILDERGRRYVEFAVDGATRMQRLINDLLTFSRIGRVYDGWEPIDLNTVLDRAEDALAITIGETGAQIVRPQLPTVPGDSTLLSMLWQNLISNAVKFRHPDRTPRVEITVEPDGDLWAFTVTDNGIGIDASYADKIFVIFQRLHQRDAYPGTGIGLAICKKVTEFHGGTIALDPEHRDGARFVVTLRRDRAGE
ncbi:MULTISPECIES: ATP-binding protein [unclassified Actinoplanes]|uniref:sensor histidine kinase n=1 Tax=unclassified Actinoplanes TaxID=2626549 RepID=UPI0009C39FDE|nr:MULTISPECIES: sensor histidine kinase [unclassified Actinoplanes]SLM01421.1 multi-sensor signal transduction histidine kinase [Actinoplanes sp. SE50/110]